MTMWLFYKIFKWGLTQLENDIDINNNLYDYYDINNISFNRMKISDGDEITIYNIYIKDNMACKIFCCLAFSVKLVFMWIFVKTICTTFDLFPSAISDFRDITENKLNLFKGIGKFILGVLCLVPCMGWAIMYYFVAVINLYVWAIFLGVLATAILIMTVISTICLCRSNPVKLYAYQRKKETEIEHNFSFKEIESPEKRNLYPLQGNQISFREKIFIRGEEIVQEPETNNENSQQEM